jgi:hypothetical protein
VFVSLRLDSSAFEKGVTATQQQAARLGQVLDQFGRPVVANVTAAAAAIEDTGNRVRAATGHFELSGRVLARFAAIGTEQLVPSLQGSRLALENILQPVVRVGSGLGTLALTGVGAAAVLGGALFAAWALTHDGAIRASSGVRGLGDEITDLEKKVTDTLPSLERLGRFSNLTRGAEPSGFEISGAPVISDLNSFLQRLFNRRAATVAGARGDIAALRGAQQLEDINIAPGGPIATKILDEEIKKLGELEKQVQSFRRAANEALVDDPLQKLLISDFQRAQELIDKLREITDSRLAEFRDAAIGEVGATAGARQLQLRDVFTKA